MAFVVYLSSLLKDMLCSPSERADAAAALPLVCTGESRAPSAPASLHARDRICEQPTAHVARGAEYDRLRLGRRGFSLGFDAVLHYCDQGERKSLGMDELATPSCRKRIRTDYSRIERDQH